MAPELILIADREPKMLSLLRQVLSGAGYGVTAAAKGAQAVQIAATEQLTLVLLDAGLAGEVDGFEAARRIREFSDVPIVLLSYADGSEEALRAFTVGADDFITKPFDPRILLARVRAILKRCQGRVPAPAEIVCDDLVIDPAARRVTRGGAEIPLTDTEYHLLLELARHRDRVLVHDQLLDAVWGTEYRSEIGYLRSYIHILRRKLEDNPSQPRLIISRPGIGYMLMTVQTKDPGT